MNVTLVHAIRDRKLLQLNYDGGYRVVEPHAYGHNQKQHHDLLRVYQVSGSSKSFEFVGWKLFECGELVSVQILDQTFAGSRAGYKRGDKAMDSIYAQL